MDGKFSDVLSGLGDTQFERELPGHHAIFIHFHCYTFVKVITKKDNIVIIIRNRTGTFHIESDCNVLFFTPLKSGRCHIQRQTPLHAVSSYFTYGNTIGMLVPSPPTSVGTGWVPTIKKQSLPRPTMKTSGSQVMATQKSFFNNIEDKEWTKLVCLFWENSKSLSTISSEKSYLLTSGPILRISWYAVSTSLSSSQFLYGFNTRSNSVMNFSATSQIIGHSFLLPPIASSWNLCISLSIFTRRKGKALTLSLSEIRQVPCHLWIQSVQPFCRTILGMRLEWHIRNQVWLFTQRWIIFTAIFLTFLVYFSLFI